MNDFHKGEYKMWSLSEIKILIPYTQEKEKTIIDQN